MKAFFGICLWVGITYRATAQELYVNSEPASNMATGAIGFRLSHEIRPLGGKTGLRTIPEIMFGFSRHLMVHISSPASNFYQPQFRLEGLNIYGKYRFLALDHPQSHFRISAFLRGSWVQNPIPNNEINLEGDNSGYQGGFITTQLLHKVAFSFTTDLTHATPNGGGFVPQGPTRNQLGYTFSTGYLWLPKLYTDYKQTNVNLYLEFIGKSESGGAGNCLDIAPAVQFIFGSKSRLDFSYRKQIEGNISRLSTESFLVRWEYNIFNAF